MYYQEQYKLGNLIPFEKHLTGYYDDQFSVEDHIQNIIEYENKYTRFIEQYAKEHGYHLDIHSPYFAGFGTISNAYYITDETGEYYILKYIYSELGRRLFSASLCAQMLVEEHGLQKFVPKIYEASVDYIKPFYGIIIQEDVGINLEVFMKTATIQQKRGICKQLKRIKYEFIKKGLTHEDARASNITVKNMTVYLIDLEEVKYIKDSRHQPFDYLSEVLEELCI